MIKNIGILTYHASHNYGSMLQTHALQSYLQKQGFNVSVINHRNLAQTYYYINPHNLLTKDNLKAFITHPRLFLQDVSKWKKFESFMIKYYNLTERCTSLVKTGEIINESLNLDAIITGGDQIWNMNSLDFSFAYYLPFETPNIRRIAYSASFGDANVWDPRTCSDILKLLVSKYDFPSVREDSSSEFMTELLGKTVPSVPDPTLLRKKEDYEHLAGDEPLIKGQYAFFYTPHYNPSIYDYAVRFAKKLKLDIVVSNGTSVEKKNMHIFNNAGPIEFLNLLKNADVVIGKSLHMVIFSLILHKQFYAFDVKKGVRISSMLNQVGLTNRYVSVEEDSIPEVLEPINWEEVDSVIEIIRGKGVDFLSQALK